MKKYTFIAVAFAALATVSCVKDNMGGAEGVVYDATFSDAVNVKATITVGAEQSLVSWETTDRVGIMYGDSNVEYKADQAGARTMLSPVSASADASEVWAVLPYDASATLAGGVISTTVPAEQTALEGGAFHHLAVAHSTNGTLAFRNVCGLVRVRVTTEGITKVVFAGKASEKVAGDVAITVAAEPAVSTGTSETVSLVPASDQTAIAVGDYFLAVLPQNFASGFTVKAYKGETAVVTKDVEGPVELKRCGVFAGTIREVTISAISTDFATVGETITVTGTGFSTTPADNVVTIGGKATEVTSASATELKVTVPKGLSRNNDYSVDVTVKGASKVSSPKFRYWYLYTYTLSGWLGAWDKYTVLGGTGEKASIGDPYFIGIDPTDADKMWIASCNPNKHTDGKPKFGISSVKLSTAVAEVVDTSAATFKGKTLWAGDFEPGSNKFHIILKGGGEKGTKTIYTYTPSNRVSAFYDPMANADPALDDPSYLLFDSKGNRYVADRDNNRIAVIAKGGGAHYVGLGIKPISFALDKNEEYLFVGTNAGYGIYRVRVADLLNSANTTLTPERIAGTGTKLDDTKANGGNGKAVEGSVGNVQAFYYDSAVNYLYYLDSQSLLFQALIPGIGGDWTKATMKTVHDQTSAFDNSGGMIEKDASGNFYIAVKGKHKIVKMIPKN